MSTLNQTVWIKQYAVPALLVIALGPIWILIWGDLNILAFGAAFVLAFVTGLLLRPAHAWIMPATVVAVFAAVVYVLEMLGASEPETNVGLIPGLTLIVGLPLTLLTWLGRELGRILPGHARQQAGPNVPTT
jgi:hypothetical protein